MLTPKLLTPMTWEPRFTVTSLVRAPHQLFLTVKIKKSSSVIHLDIKFIFSVDWVNVIARCQRAHPVVQIRSHKDVHTHFRKTTFIPCILTMLVLLKMAHMHYIFIKKNINETSYQPSVSRGRSHKTEVFKPNPLKRYMRLSISNIGILQMRWLCYKQTDCTRCDDCQDDLF